MDNVSELQDAKESLYNLLEKVIFSTGCGEKSDDYTKTLSLDIGGGILSYDPYYQQLSFFDSDDVEFELGDDLDVINLLIKEISKRLKEFEKKISKTRSQLAKGIFDKPLKGVIEDG